MKGLDKYMLFVAIGAAFLLLISRFRADGLEIFIKLIFGCALLVYYWVNSKQLKPLVFVSLICLCVAQVGIYLDFIDYYNVILITFALSCLLNIYILFPMLRKLELQSRNIDVTNLTVASAGILAFTVTLIYYTYSLVPSAFAYLMTVVVLLSFVFVCLGIYAFNRHKKGALLVITAIAFLLSGFGTIIYEYAFSKTYFLYILDFVEITGMFAFVGYLTRMDQTLGLEKWDI